MTALYPRAGHAASFDVCAVAELDGALAGVLASFPVAESDARARRFVRLTAPRVPPWRWPALMRHLRAAALLSPHPPPDTLYVDALAVDAQFRRSGVARTLLARARGGRGSGRAMRASRSTPGSRTTPRARSTPPPATRSARSAARPTRAVAAAVGGPGFVSYVKRV